MIEALDVRKTFRVHRRQTNGTSGNRWHLKTSVLPVAL